MKPKDDVSRTEYIALGRIQAPWGLKGEVKFHLYHADSQTIFKTRQIFLKAGFSFSEKNLLSARRHGRSVLLHLDGYSSPEQAAGLKGEEVFVPEDLLPKKKKGEYYIFELIGMEVVLPSGEKIGEVKDVVSYGASEILVVSSPARGEIMIPLIPDFLREISPMERKIRVESVEGLTESS
ncbi:MAG: ribosome maturation factor RimM [bacterium]